MPSFVVLLARPLLSRRAVVVTSLATGFALAVQPVSAQTRSRPTRTGLRPARSKSHRPRRDPRLPGHAGEGGPFPVVLVVQEIFGVHEHIKDLCRRLAKLGYLAIAPELYARQGDVSKMKDVQQIIPKVVSKVPDAQVMSDLDATVAWAKETGKGDTRGSAITGFCWGGRIVWLYAAHNPNLKAGVAWYGRLVGEPDTVDAEEPDRPRDRVEGPGPRPLRRSRPASRSSTIEQMQQAPSRSQNLRIRRLPRRAS